MSTEPTLGHASFYPNPTSHSFAKTMKDAKCEPEFAAEETKWNGANPLAAEISSLKQQLQQQHAALLAARDALELLTIAPSYISAHAKARCLDQAITALSAALAGDKGNNL